MDGDKISVQIRKKKVPRKYVTKDARDFANRNISRVRRKGTDNVDSGKFYQHIEISTCYFAVFGILFKLMENLILSLAHPVF